MNTPRRLTLMIDSLAAGGAQTQIVRLAAGMDPTRWSTRLAWYNDTARFHAAPAAVEAVQLPRRGRTDPRFPLAMASLCRRSRTDLVHAWLPAPGLYAATAGRLPGGAPVILGVRCSAGIFETEPVQGHLTLAAALLARAVTVNSRSVIHWLAARGVPRAKMRFIGNILAPAIAERTPSSPDQRAALLAGLGLDPCRPPIVALGRFDAFKNQDGLLRALLALRDRGVEVPPLLLAGSAEDGTRVEAVRKMAAAAGFTDLHVVPPVVDVATLLEVARFSVLASRSEGTPNVVLEGLGLGTLVVATRVGEVADLARDGDTGFTCPPDDHEALAAALLRALQLPAAAAAEMGQRARADMLARFAAPIIVGQYEALYEEILNSQA